MRKSIESTWKESFLNKDALVAPKLNDLYNKKSVHLVDKYKRMFKWNIWLVFFGSFLFLALSFIVRIPILGALLFIILQYLAYVDKSLLRDLKEIDKNTNSYAYLKKLDDWLKKKTSTNVRIARFMYPYILFSMVLGFWFMKLDDGILGDKIMQNLLEFFPSMPLVLGAPLLGIILLAVCLIALYHFGAKLYHLDMNIVYGEILAKLGELLEDMEQLRAEPQGRKA